MSVPSIVIDTNVLVAAIRSKRGASRKLMLLIDSGKFNANISVSLILEYEAAAKRHARQAGLTVRDIDDILDYVCKVATPREVFYLWRPMLKDPKDDMLLELAVTAGCEYIVTFNTTDFAGVQRFGIESVTPREFLRTIGELL